MREREDHPCDVHHRVQHLGHPVRAFRVRDAPVAHRLQQRGREDRAAAEAAEPCRTHRGEIVDRLLERGVRSVRGPVRREVQRAAVQVLKHHAVLVVGELEDVGDGDDVLQPLGDLRVQIHRALRRHGAEQRERRAGERWVRHRLRKAFKKLFRVLELALEHARVPLRDGAVRQDVQHDRLLRRRRRGRRHRERRVVVAVVGAVVVA
mmetsp:Transcript_22438/g.69610  ORF Transcript_22438/g.69610 Transcript_22438/m.69610 type:complete len:207 (+) Transcript_22438:337-957(+)